jgi:hypothetical protein
MEEGPEPQELLEQGEHSHHALEHGHEEGDSEAKQFIMRSAITASILAVCAAVGSLLSGHAANEAILKTVEASDQWSFYQAKSTKSHIFEGNKLLLSALSEKTGGAQKSLEDFDKKLSKYDSEKEEIKKQAEAIERTGKDEFARHQQYSLAVACFQIGIVLSSVAILVRNNWLYWQSIAAGAVGVGFCLWGYLGH